VVGILLAVLRKTASTGAAGGRRVSSAPVWLGVLGAVMVAGSFAAVLTSRPASCRAGRRRRPRGC
jgi:high-affinity iron transporter